METIVTLLFGFALIIAIWALISGVSVILDRDPA